MSERLLGLPESTTPLFTYLIENDFECTFVFFNVDLDALGRAVILGIMKGQKDGQIAQESARTIGAVQAKMKLLKKGVRRRDKIWPHDRMDLVYTLQSLGDISIGKVRK